MYITVAAAVLVFTVLAVWILEGDATIALITVPLGLALIWQGRKHEIKLLKQCMYKVLGYSDHTTYYRTRGTRQKIGIYCTKAQRIEIELEFEFYRNVFYEELPSFMNAFIQAQGIFPTDAPRSNKELWDLSEDELRQLQMAEGIKKRTRAAMIEEREDTGNE